MSLLRALIATGCLLLAGCVGSAARGDRYRVDIQAVFDMAGNPEMVANFSPDGGLATPRWRACPGRRVNACEPGPTPAGTIFEARARYRGRTYVGRTPSWRGTVRSSAPPRLEGAARVGSTVRALAGRWAGGWGGEFDRMRVQACRTAAARRCRTISPQNRSAAVVRRRYAGWYLFAFDERFARDQVFGEPAYGRPEAIPPVEAGPTVSRSAPFGPVAAR